MDKLYAPWRDRYVHTQIKGEQSGACVFCEVFTDTQSDESRLVLFRNQDIAVMLNLYPYNGGHLLVVPKNHVAEYYELPESILHQLMSATSKSMQIIKKEFNCDGINFGANVGRAAGAGIPQHVHMHIVPRFAGDTGFFTTIGESKQVSVDLEKIYKNLKPHFDKNFIG
ncbi:MAG: HIT domain-containing protein [Candidatus Dependentiae bacterium]|nr:HIT domain-containing protein [Candidatus Dependentiae bacterium]